MNISVPRTVGGTTTAPIPTLPIHANDFPITVDIKWAPNVSLLTSDQVGDKQGYASFDDAVTALGTLTQGAGSAVVYQDGSRYFGRDLLYKKEASFSPNGDPNMYRTWKSWEPYDVGMFGERGLKFEAPGAIAVVDGSVVVKRPSSSTSTTTF